MKFSDVFGQGEIKEKLVNMVRENRVGHSILFYGPQGSGKLPLAISFAQFISCEDRQESDSCGKWKGRPEKDF